MENNSLANVKHIHPPISNSESKEERSSGLDDAACCASASDLSSDGRWLCMMDDPDYIKGRWAAENMSQEERQEQLKVLLAKHTS
jgi:hypothetical protein